MRQSTSPATSSHITRADAVYAAAVAAPAVVMAAAGALSAAAVPVAVLLGVFLAAVVAYFSSARSLVERPTRAKTALRAAASQATGSPAASGAC